MSKFAIAFIAPAENSQLKHKIVDGANQDAALKAFFTDEAAEYYSADEQGYYYFKEDFFDASVPSGSIIQCG